MLTAGSIMDIDPPHNHMYQHSNYQSRKSQSSSNTRFTPATSEVAPSLFWGDCLLEDDDKMDYSSSQDQISPHDEGKTMQINKSTLNMDDFISVDKRSFQPPGFARFDLNQFPLNFLQASAMHNRDAQNLTGDRKLDVASTTANNHQRSSSAEQLYAMDSQSLRTNTYCPDDDSDDSWKICGVCNDKATGYHFNALTCEGCKGFFRRSIKNGKNFSCSYNNQCSITKNNRRQCQACRLQKCIQIGMKRECIMSTDQIQSKKILVLTNRMKKTAQEWTPMPMTLEQKELLEIICTAFKDSNEIPSITDLRGTDVVEKDAVVNQQSDCSSPSSSTVELIKQIQSDIAAHTPSNMIEASHVMHFTDIMEFSIREVIKFCKRIPTFLDLDLNDQVALLKAGCTEILFLKANYTYDFDKKALTLGPDLLYTKESFLQGGMSEDYSDAYLKFHDDLGMLQLDDQEMSSLSAIALFSADRSDLTAPDRVEAQQEVMACALQSYTESVLQIRHRFASIMSFLPRLRTLNALCQNAISHAHKDYGNKIHPLVFEVQPDDDEDDFSD